MFSNRMTTSQVKQETRILVQAAAAVCEDKKGEDTRILELDPVDSGLSDFFLITSASNERQAVAIADDIEFRLKRDFGAYAHSVEGRRQGEWILLDYVDFVVHVFLTERRAFYDIERLRKSARPMTPAEFDAELKAELAEKTRTVREKAPVVAKAKKAVKKTPVVAKAKKAVKKAPVVAKAKKAVKKTPVVAKAKKAVKKTPVVAKAKKAVKKAPVKAKAKKAVKKVPVVAKVNKTAKKAPVKAKAKPVAKRKSAGR